MPPIINLCFVSIFILLYTSCTNNSDMLSHNSAITPPPSSLNISHPTPTLSLTNETTAKPTITPKPIQRQSSPALNKQKIFALSPFIKIAQIEGGNGLKELSGQTPTTKRGEFWGINDKGNDPEVFRFSINGSVLQQVKIKKVDNDDWEAIARHPDGSLLIGGVGDNDEVKKEYAIYQIHAPERNDDTIKSQETFEFVYSDQRSHNCEAMFVLDNKVYLITKEKNEHNHAKFFRLDVLRPNQTLTAKEVTTLTEPGVVSDAAYDPSIELLAVLTYNQIMLFRVANERDLYNAPIFRMAIDLKQCEGVCFYGDELIVSNEDGELWAAKIEQR